MWYIGTNILEEGDTSIFDPSTLRMETELYFETFVPMILTTRCHIPEYGNNNTHSREKLKFRNGIRVNYVWPLHLITPCPLLGWRICSYTRDTDILSGTIRIE